MNTRTIGLSLFVASLLVASLSSACGTTPASSTAGSSSSSPTAGAGSPSSTAPASEGPAATLYTFAPEPGSAVSGTVQVATSPAGATLTATVHGLEPGSTYIVDADPLPCLLFAGGPSQSFAHSLVADSSGGATVTWTVPSGMDGNASVQGLTNQGTFAVLACADLTQ
jgi:hypothetical protein